MLSKVCGGTRSANLAGKADARCATSYLSIGSPRVSHYSRTAGTWPAAPDASIARDDYHDLYIVACAARQPPAVPGLINRRLIRTVCYVMDVIHDLLVIPAGGKLGFAGIAHAMPMTTSAGRVAVENVRGTFRSDAERVQRRTLPGIYCVPAGTIRPRALRYTVIVTVGDGPAVGGAL
jgi:hypothetical protein